MTGGNIFPFNRLRLLNYLRFLRVVGTGMLVVRLVDVNDNSPRLTRDLWVVEVKETWGDGPASNYTLLQVTTADQDTSNYFYYRVRGLSDYSVIHGSCISYTCMYLFMVTVVYA